MSLGKFRTKSIASGAPPSCETGSATPSFPNWSSALYDSNMGREKKVWRNDPPRFQPRVMPSGKILYYYQAAGKKIPLGSNLVAAKAEWARLEAGHHVKHFPEVAAEYRKLFPGFALSTRTHYEGALRNLELTFRKFTLEQIKPHHVKTYIRQRTKKGAAMFEKRVLSALYEWARGEGITHAPNPCRGISFTKAERKMFAPKKPKVYVTDAMFDEVWGCGDEILQDAMDLALYTGQRPGDILSARRHDIADGVLWFQQQKTGARVGVRVKGGLERVLGRILARPRPIQSLYLIADRHGQRLTYNALNARFCKARGTSSWQFRHIRTKASADSPSLKRAQQLLGHATETTTATSYRPRGEIVDPLERNLERVLNSGAQVAE